MAKCWILICFAILGWTHALSLSRPNMALRSKVSNGVPFQWSMKASATSDENNNNIGRQINTRLRASSVANPFARKSDIGFLKDKAASLARSLRTDEVSQWRAAAAVFLSSLVIFRRPLDGALANFWTFLTTSNHFFAMWFRHDHWEWLLAVTCFFVYIHGFMFADWAVLKAAKKGRDHPLRKHRLQDRLVAQQHYADLKKRQDAGEAVDINEPPPLVKEHSKWHFGGYIGELWVYMVPLFIWDTLDPRRHRSIARTLASPPTTFGIMRDVTCGLLLYDLFFFMGHVIMHKVPFIYRTIHKKHHITPEVRSGDIVRLSVIEQVLEVGFSIIALRMLKCHMLSRTIYNIIITFLLTELHCGFDFPWTPQNVVPFGLATGSRRHHYHHRYGRHYYQKFFCHVDRLFGFFQKDDKSVVGDSVKPLNAIAHKMNLPKNDHK